MKRLLTAVIVCLAAAAISASGGEVPNACSASRAADAEVFLPIPEPDAIKAEPFGYCSDNSTCNCLTRYYCCRDETSCTLECTLWGDTDIDEVFELEDCDDATCRDICETTYPGSCTEDKCTLPTNPAD